MLALVTEIHALEDLESPLKDLEDFEDLFYHGTWVCRPFAHKRYYIQPITSQYLRWRYDRVGDTIAAFHSTRSPEKAQQSNSKWL